MPVTRIPQESSFSAAIVVEPPLPERELFIFSWEPVEKLHVSARGS